MSEDTAVACGIGHLGPIFSWFSFVVRRQWLQSDRLFDPPDDIQAGSVFDHGASAAPSQRIKGPLFPVASQPAENYPAAWQVPIERVFGKLVAGAKHALAAGILDTKSHVGIFNAVELHVFTVNVDGDVELLRFLADVVEVDSDSFVVACTISGGVVAAMRHTGSFFVCEADSKVYFFVCFEPDNGSIEIDLALAFPSKPDHDRFALLGQESAIVFLHLEGLFHGQVAFALEAVVNPLVTLESDSLFALLPVSALCRLCDMCGNPFVATVSLPPQRAHDHCSVGATAAYGDRPDHLALAGSQDSQVGLGSLNLREVAFRVCRDDEHDDGGAGIQLRRVDTDELVIALAFARLVVARVHYGTVHDIQLLVERSVLHLPHRIEQDSSRIQVYRVHPREEIPRQPQLED